MVEHIGRISGLRRNAVLEIVDRPGPGSYVVVAGFGRRAQWLRNVKANPHVRVYLDSRAPAAAVARRLDSGASAASLGRYASARFLRRRSEPASMSGAASYRWSLSTSTPMI